ncbi:50S ribosomal protein L5 [candidate division WOR-3 bacterium JGI_Cruoil_03_51_56]|uniref:Large ribosomal subunit protein uL5 n=1 Tax=candidate division WOR-3 bacterium JGI_Cruoil_03_51_56 TaxID=1973747 RepID=A0A235BXQ8_UNCW3|nr:MAG: 50S ribosomal protein L5 [candidate division WOR-3 bacterium JGI_Cruoil_03_51_56]
MTPRLKERYLDKIVPALTAQFEYKNRFQVPHLVKVVVNVTTKEAVADPKVLDVISDDLARITGQRPSRTTAKRAISAFRIRRGMPLGVKVTLRGDRMYEFIDRFFNFAVPQIRDFQGFSPDSFDGRGSYSLGLSEQLIFPEIEVSKVKKVFGMNITFHTTARHDDEARALLAALGLAFRRK